MANDNPRTIRLDDDYDTALELLAVAEDKKSAVLAREILQEGIDRRLTPEFITAKYDAKLQQALAAAEQIRQQHKRGS